MVIWGVVGVSQLALIIIGVGVGSQSGAFRWSRLIHFRLGFLDLVILSFLDVLDMYFVKTIFSQCLSFAFSSLQQVC